MATHRRSGWSEDRRLRSARGVRGDRATAQTVAIGMAAVGATLVVGAAGALHVTGSAEDPDMSTTAQARDGVVPATSTRPEVATPHRITDSADSPGPTASGGHEAVAPGARPAAGVIPGVGDLMMARIPSSTRQVIVVTGADQSSTVNRVVLWQRADADAPWTAVGAEIPGRNGANGWSHDHVEGDLRSPVGVFSLTAAGGRYADPGTALPYEYRPSFYQAGGYEGDPMGEAFNYVVAIDYNRLPGHPPSDPTRPLGAAAGGDIWLHVDHNTPTRGCVSLPQASMETVLHWLAPSSHPMIIMGDRASLQASAGQQ
ncbi:transpeptidase [Parafrankia discariae]|uniref:transpeptidase n=1 Tax=Parafrankia discariae TaxID=365528 RepID=UPI00039AA860|nr:transpeptidase [Parafrankia discariae]